MKRAIVGLVTATTAAAAIILATGIGDAATSSYRFVAVEQGDVEAVVAATGALSAVTTVQVGTQVSGQIERVFVDFNDRVTRGQLIARIDATILQQAVLDAEANLERVQADLARREWVYERTTELFSKQGVTESEYKTAEYDLAVARANLKSAQVALQRARDNLAYSEVYAPIDGVVIERNVEPGQTVAATMSTPQLFLIANDLAEMEILASVDESDIGQISEGQEARFTVQAHPDETFSGTVRQVRLESAVQENVVNYTVVVSVRNDDGKLLPGMTATVDFVVEKVEEVLKVPNAALRFQPTQAMLEEVHERQRALSEGTIPKEVGESDSDSVRAGPRERFAQGGQRRGGQAGVGGREGGLGGFAGRASGNASQLWYVDEEGLLQVMRVRPGVTDGQSTQVAGRGLEPGMQVIASVVITSAEAASINPFQQQQSQNRPRRGF
jgi:HlyD family secretion protein